MDYSATHILSLRQQENIIKSSIGKNNDTFLCAFVTNFLKATLYKSRKQVCVMQVGVLYAKIR